MPRSSIFIFFGKNSKYLSVVIVRCFFKKIGTLNKDGFEKQAQYPAFGMQAFGPRSTNQREILKKFRMIIQILNQ
jgi:hypothetical protein